MKIDINRFVSLRNSLLQERATLEARLKEIVNALDQSQPVATPVETATPAKSTGKRKMSQATKAKLRASQQARWAKIKGVAADKTKAVVNAPKKARGKISAEGRARMIAGTKARWARINAEKAARLKAGK